MSKNTASSAFRKIDVDAFNEDNFRDDDTTSAPNANAGAGSADANQVMALLQQGKGVDALKMVLGQAPIGNKDQQERVSNRFPTLISNFLHFLDDFIDFEVFVERQKLL